MGFWDIYGAVVVGVVLSVMWPVLKEAIPKPGRGLGRKEYWALVKPYVALAAFSGLTGLLVVAFLGDTLGVDWRPALLAGYAWDSTLQKVKGPPA